MSTLEVQRLGKRFPVRGAGLRREMLRRASRTCRSRCAPAT